MDQVRLIRELFQRSDEKRDKDFVTPEDIVRNDDITYGPDSKWNLLDIYYKKGTTACQNTIISIHGGAWVYGDKECYQYYCMNLAQRGFTVVNFSYRLAPEAKYPAALEDINAAFAWVKEHASEYYIDLDNLFVVGDSAGAQLGSQYLTILTNPEYEKQFTFDVPEVTVRAAALNCGIYDAKEYCNRSQGELLKCYLGKEPEEIPTIDVMSYITEKFPASFIMSSYTDPMLQYAEPMYERLKEAGVDTVLKIYGAPEKKEIGHVFHCNIVLEEAIQCNDEECEFFQAHSTCAGKEKIEVLGH